MHLGDFGGPLEGVLLADYLVVKKQRLTWTRSSTLVDAIAT